MKNDLNISASKVIVDIHATKEFTEADLAIHEMVRVKEAYPSVYSNETPPGVSGIQYLETKLVNIDDIDNNNVDFNQTVRATTNPKMNDIRENIQMNGWMLSEPSVFLTEVGEGKYAPLDARTRIHILREMGVKNVIADIFKCDSKASALRFGILSNEIKKPYGEASFYDIEKVIRQLVVMGEIPETETRDEFYDVVRAEILGMTKKLKPAQIDQIILNAYDTREGFTSVISFPNGVGADDWLRKRGYTNSTDRVYIPVSTFDEKVILSAIRNQRKYPSSVKEILFVVHGGTLSAKDPEADWENRVRDFKANFEAKLRDISDTFYGGAPLKFKRVKVHGAIPMVTSLSEKYDMDLIHHFD